MDPPTPPVPSGSTWTWDDMLAAIPNSPEGQVNFLQGHTPEMDIKSSEEPPPLLPSSLCPSVTARMEQSLTIDIGSLALSDTDITDITTPPYIATKEQTPFESPRALGDPPSHSKPGHFVTDISYRLERFMFDDSPSVMPVCTPESTPVTTQSPSPEQTEKMLNSIRAPLSNSVVGALCAIAIHNIHPARPDVVNAQNMVNDMVSAALEDILEERLNILAGIRQNPKKYLDYLDTDFNAVAHKRLEGLWQGRDSLLSMEVWQMNLLVPAIFEACFYIRQLERQFGLTTEER